VAALLVGLTSRVASAVVVVAAPYYAPYARWYQPVDALPPTGAALGPWRWNFNIGGGPVPLLGSTGNQLNDGWNFTVGGGYNITPRLGFIFEFMDSGFGLTDSALQRNGAVGGDGSVWSLTLNPIWRFRIGGPVGGYLIGGGGFYEREDRFDVPVTVFVPTFHGGYYASGLDRMRNIDDTGGVNAGAGMTCNLGWGTKLFVEVRYHYIFTAGKPTQLLPVTFGLRW